MKLTYFIYLQLTIRWLIKHFTVIYRDANKQFLTLTWIFFATKKSPYLGSQSPYQKLQFSLFEPKKRSHVCMPLNAGLSYPKVSKLIVSLGTYVANFCGKLKFTSYNMSHVMRKHDADQPVHPCSLISAFVVCCLDTKCSIIPLVSIP